MNNEDITTLDDLENETKRNIVSLKEAIVREAPRSEDIGLVRLCATLQTYESILSVLKGKK